MEKEKNASEEIFDDDIPEVYAVPDQVDISPKELGIKGERAARRFLEARGFEILDTNWKCFAGEADIVALDGDTICFIEVKTRRDIQKGMPEEAVTAEKRSRYEKIAACYLQSHAYVDLRVRFDVIGLLVVAPDRAFLKMYVNAFGAGDNG